MNASQTSYENIYRVFLMKTKDYDLISELLKEENDDVVDDIEELTLDSLEDESGTGLGNNTEEPNEEVIKVSQKLHDLCFDFLRGAIPKFYNSRVDLSDRDDEYGYFNSELNDLEVEILGSLMVTEWLSPQIYNITLLKQFLNDSEYRHYSQANHLDKLMKLKDATEDDVHRLIILYTNDIMESIND